MSIRMEQGIPVPPIRRASAHVKTADVPTHSGRYLADVPSRHIAPIHHARTLPVTTEHPKAVKHEERIRARNRFLTFLGVGALCMVGLINAFSWVGATFERSSVQQVYGQSQAVILETRVGHQDKDRPTVFIGFPRNGRIYLVELAGGDPEQTQVYLLGYYAGREEDLLLVLTPRDVNGDGMIDLVVTTKNSQFHTLLYNTGKSFQSDVPESTKEGSKP